MTLKELLKKNRKEKKEIRIKIKELEDEINKKRDDENVFIPNTLWEEMKLRRLYEQLGEDE